VTAAFNLELRYGVLAGLTGDGAAFGQPWNQAAILAVDYINAALKDMGLTEKWKLTMVGAQDTGGNAQQGVEAAKKLVGIDRATIVIGDFFSASTAAVAPAVTISGQGAAVHWWHQSVADQAQHARRANAAVAAGAGR
jgi:branched-chain amino acid transport system substrate-binding protein